MVMYRPENRPHQPRVGSGFSALGKGGVKKKSSACGLEGGELKTTKRRTQSTSEMQSPFVLSSYGHTQPAYASFVATPYPPSPYTNDVVRDARTSTYLPPSDNEGIAGRRRSNTTGSGGCQMPDALQNHLFDPQYDSSSRRGTCHSLQLDEMQSHIVPVKDNHHYESYDSEKGNHQASPFTPRTAEENEHIIGLNVGGTSYKLSSKLALRFPAGTLADLVRADHSSRLSKVDGYLEPTNEYFYARSAQLFDCIYRFYCSGHLHRPLDVCLTEYKEELTFWRLDESLYSHCCFPRLLFEDDTSTKDDEFVNVWYGDRRRELWKFIEGSGTFGSNIFSFLSILFVLLSVSGLVISSIPELQVPILGELPQNTSDIEGGPDVYLSSQMEPHVAFTYLESVCIIWFTGEFLARFITTPSKCVFLKGSLNIVDLLAIVPFYLELTLNLVGIDTNSLRDLKGALLVIRILRVLRVVRIFKLGRYSAGMRTFALTLQSSAKQLGMMAMVMTTGVIFFSTMVYFLEKDEPDTPFSSIPAAFWWCIVTMTTVGYGDVVPVTLAGKIVASGAIVSGVLVLALPITIIVDNFMKVSGKSEPDVEGEEPAAKVSGWAPLHRHD